MVVIFLLFLMPMDVRAQQPQPTPGPENMPVDDSPLAAPVTLNGQGGPLAFQSEAPAQSYLSGGISAAGVYTENALLTNANKLENFGYMVQSHIAWSQMTSRLKWNLGLNGGFIGNSNLGAQNQAAESATIDATWRLTEHVSFRLSDTFGNVTGLFSSISSQTQQTGVGVVEKSNNTLLVPPVQRVLSNESLLEIGVQVGPNTVTGVRGSYGLIDYPTSSQSAQFGTLYNTRGYSAEAFYDWKFAVRQWVGLTVRGQRFETLPAIARTDVGSVLLYYSFTATPTVTLTLFGGPEYSNTSSAAATAAPGLNGQGHFWSSGEGATLNWGGIRTSANVSYVRQLNDGGGLASSVTLQTASAALRRQLSRRQNEIQFSVAYSRNNLLLSPSLSAPSIQGLSALASFEQHFARSFAAGVAYSWQRQDLPSSGTSSYTSVVSFTLSYDFSHPLGK